MCTRAQLDAFERSTPSPPPHLDRRNRFLPSLSGFFSSYRYLSAVHSSKRRCLTGRGKKKEREEKWKKVSIPSHRFVSTFRRYDRESFACSTRPFHIENVSFFSISRATFHRGIRECRRKEKEREE